MMTDLEAYGIRLMRCRSVAWQPGMLAIVPPRRDGATGYTVRVTEGTGPVNAVNAYADLSDPATLGCAVEEREKARKALQVLDAELADFVQHAEKDMPGIEYQAIGADIQGRVNKAVEQLQYAAKKWYHFASEAKRRGLA